jgi:NitT/TauT family transport system permease protein
MNENHTVKDQPISRGQSRSRWYRIFLVPISLVTALVLWDVFVKIGDFPPYIFPSPARVLDRLLVSVGDGSLLRNTLYTLVEVLVGLILGVTAATALGYLLAKSLSIERILSPYIIASQAVPIVAIAPLLIRWFGSGSLSKILICSLIVFFPVLVNTVVGLRSVPNELRDLMKSLRATRSQTFRYLEIPAALPIFLGGLRIGATLAVIGAIVGEFVGADRGLGFLINQSRGLYDTAMVFVAIMTLVVMALSLYFSVVLLEKYTLSWNKPQDQ